MTESAGIYFAVQTMKLGGEDLLDQACVPRQIRDTLSKIVAAYKYASTIPVFQRDSKLYEKWSGECN